MVAESNVGARIALIGKAAFLTGIKEASAAVKAANAEMAASNKAAVDSQLKGYATLEEAQAAYRAKTAESAAANVASATAMGKRLAFGLGAATAVFAYEGLKIHAQFQSAMLQSVNLAGVAQSRLGALTSGIKAMSPAVNQGLVPLANALYRIASTPAGLKATNSQLLDMVKYAGMLTTIGGPGTDLEQTARIMGGAMSTGIKGASSPKQIATLAAATVGSGDIRMSDVVDFMGTGVLTSAGLTGIPLNQTMAFLALAGSNLQSGQVSGHALAHGLQLLFAPTPQAQKAMGVMGLGATTLAQTGRNKGLPAAIAQLRSHLEGPLAAGSGSQLAAFGFNPQEIARAQSVGLGAMGSEGQSLMNLLLTRMFGGAKMGIPLDMLVSQSGNYNKILSHINKATSDPNTLNKDMARQMDTLSGKSGQFAKSIQSLADTFGKDLTPAAKEFLGVGASIATTLATNKWAFGALAGLITFTVGPVIGLYLVGKFRAAKAAIVDSYRAILRFLGLLGSEDAGLLANDAALATNTRAELANDAARGGKGAGVLRFLGGLLGDAGLGAAGAAAVPVAVGAAGVGLGLYLRTDKRGLPKGQTAIPMGSTGRIGGITSTAFSHPHAQVSLRPIRLPSHEDHPHVGPSGLGAFGPPTVQAHVYIDGKEVFTQVQKQARKTVARN